MNSYDRLKLAELYQLMLLENFNLDEYLTSDYLGSDSILLWESVEKIQNGISKDGGTLDQYEIILTNSQSFLVDIHYLSPKKSQDTIIANKQSNKKGATPSDAYYLYEKYFSDISIDDCICYVSFKDSQNRQTTTGEVGLMAKGVFSGLKAAILDSTSGRNDLKAICLKAIGTDNTRVRLFHKLMEKYLKFSFPNIILDYSSDNPYVLIVASK